MITSKDQFGTEVHIGDNVLFTYSRTNGNTALTKGKIHSFTDGGNPRILVSSWIYDRNTRTSSPGLKVKALTGSWAKAFDDLGSEENKNLN